MVCCQWQIRVGKDNKFKYAPRQDEFKEDDYNCSSFFYKLRRNKHTHMN